MRDLNGKRALVTGAAGGIGQALSRELARHQTEVVMLDVDGDALTEAAANLQQDGHKVSTIVCNLRNRDQLAEAVQSTLAEGPVDLLINNAGVGHYGPAHAMSSEEWDRVIEINLTAPIRLTSLLLNPMRTRPEAHIVNMCSMFGFVGMRRLVAYCTTKSGLIGFSESLRADLGRTNVSVTAMCPGFVWTDFFASCSHEASRVSAQIPPRWACTTPEKLARKTVRAIRRNRRMVVATPLAHALYLMRRLAPGLLIGLQTISRKNRRQDEQQPASSRPRKAA